MSFTWGATFKSEPAGSQSPTLGDDRIRETRGAVQERIENEHYTVTDEQSNGSAVQDWWHKEGSAKIFYKSATAPTTRVTSDPVCTVSLNSEDAGRLWLDFDTTPDTLSVYTGSAWAEIVGATTVMQLVGNQTVAGVKTFSDTIIVSGGIGDIVLYSDATDNESKFGSLTEAGDQLLIKSGPTLATALSFSGNNSIFAGNVTINGAITTLGSAPTDAVTVIAAAWAIPEEWVLTGTLDDATGNEVMMTIDYTVDKATSGTNTGLLIAMTNTSSPGVSLPLNITVEDSSVLNVKNNGDLTITGTITAAGIAYGGHNIPEENNEADLGSTAKGWKDLHFSGQIVPPEDIVSGEGSTLVGWGGPLIPRLNAVYDLGTPTKEWGDLYVCGTGHIAHLQIADFGADWTNADRTVADLGIVTTVDINGGTVDGVIIGGASAAAATITTLTITSFAANWTNVNRTVADLGSVSTVDINGGTVDGVTIGSGGGVTIVGVDINNSDISGGTLEGVDIGSATPGPVKGTNFRMEQISFNNGDTYLKTIIVEIGEWNIDTAAGGNQEKVVDTGVNKAKWRGMLVVLRNDDGEHYTDATSWRTYSVTSGHTDLEDTEVVLISSAAPNGEYTNTSGYNRGWVTLTYDTA